ncbi:MAG: Ig-like domain-containing protein [Prevotella sp.]|nr:Ig-like domain-containing protein [Prevotella sp.]
MKRFYLTLCFLMSIIGSAWGQTVIPETSESWSVSDYRASNDAAPTVGTQITGANGIVTVQFGAEGSNDGSGNATWGYGTDTNGTDVVRLTGGTRSFFVEDNTVKGCYVSFTSVYSGTLTVRLYNGHKDSNIKYFWQTTETDSEGNVSLSRSTDTGEIPYGGIGEYSMQVEAGKTYYFNTNGTGNRGIAGYSFTRALLIGTDAASATNQYIYEYKGCKINATNKPGQLIDSAHDGDYVKFNVKPTETGWYSFVSEIGTKNNGRTVTVSCSTGSETKNIKNDVNYLSAEKYMWIFELTAGEEYTITITTNDSDGSGTADEGYTVNVYAMEIKKTDALDATAVYIGDFNYNKSVRPSARTYRGLDISFGGNTKVSNSAYNEVRVMNDAGSMTVSLPEQTNDSGEKRGIYKVVFKSELYDADMTTGDVTGTWRTEGNFKTWTSKYPVNSVTFTRATGSEGSIDIILFDVQIYGGPQLNKGAYTPYMSFEKGNITASKDAKLTNALTIKESENGDVMEGFRVIYESSNTDVATVAEDGTVTAKGVGTATITARFNGKRMDATAESGSANNGYNAAEATYTITVTAGTSLWDFTTWTDSDKAILDGDAWDEYGDSEPNRYTNNNKLDNSEIGFSMTGGLTFSTSGADQMSVYYSADGDGSIRVHNASTKITIPDLFAGQVLKFTTQSTGSEARGLVPVEGTEGLELISAADKGTGVFVSMYRVKTNGTYSFCSSHNGLHIYKIELQEVKEDPNLSFAKNVLVADIATGDIYAYNNDGVTVNTNDLFDESGNLQNPNSLKVTYQSSDETVVTVDESGNVTFAPTATAGKEVKIFAIYEGDENYSLKSISYTLRLKVKTSISYAETTKSVPLNVGFVEPQPTIEPAGVNIVEYTSSNTTAATIMSNTGEVTLLDAGETVITASIPDNEYYMGASALYTLTVAAAAHTGNFNYKIEGVGTQYDKVSGEASRWSGHKFEIDQTNNNTEQSVISGINFTCLPAVEITLGAYDGTSQWTISTGDRDTSGKLYAALKDAEGKKINVILPTDAEGNITSLLPTGGTYIALEPVMSGVLAIEAEYFGDQNVVIVDKQTGEIVDSYHPGHNTNNYGNHEFSKILEAGKTYYVYNIGNNKKGDEYQNWGFNFKSISFSPVFVDKLTKVTPSTKVFAITGDAMAKGTSVIPTIASERHDHDEITYTTTQENVIYMNDNGVFTLGDGLIGINDANTIEATLTATSTAVDETNKHTSVATCVVQYTKSSLKFTPASITVPVNQGTGIEIDEPKLSYTGSDVAYSSSDASNFSVDGTTGEVTLAKESATGVTITAALTGEGRMYYVTPATYQIIAAAQASPLKVINKEVELVVGTAGYSLVGNNDIGIDENDTEKIFWINNDKKEYYEDADESNKGQRFFENRFTIKDANILSINKFLKVDAKSVGTTTVTVTTKPIKEGDNVLYEPTELTITVHVVERTFNPEEATLRVWDFTKGMDTNALKTMAESYSNYWTYDAEKGVAKTNVVGQVKGEEYVCEMTDGFNETKKVFEEQGFGLADFVTTSAETEVAANSLLLTTFNRSNMETHNGYVEKGENKEATTATDITLNALSTIGEVPGITKIPGQDLVEDPDEIEYKNNYRGIELHGHASFIVVDGIKDGVTVSIVADNVNATDIVEGNYMQLASNLKNQPLQGIFPNKFKDAKDPENNKYYYNRLTNVFIYKPATDTEDNTVTKAGFETTGIRINVTNLLMGYPAASGMLNEGDKTTTSRDGSTVKRTEGYATFVSPYNIDMTGQKVLKAYICDYYGEGNKQVHMKQVRNIPANTPVLLKGYARDMYVLYVSEGNKAVELGYGENNDALLAANKLVGLTEARDIQMTETEVSADGSQTTYYNFGLSGNKWAKFSSTGTGVAGKAYLRLTEEEFADLMASSISTSSSSARATFVFEDLPEDDTTGSTTGIEVIETQNSNNYDGGDYYYGINGLRIGKDKPTAKGLYIYKGKKIIIK